jgi:protein-disulfide isomerase
LSLQTADFETCLDSGRWASVVNADRAEGTNLGVQGTPTFFIDGYPLVGAVPYETFQYAIELAEQGKLGEAYRQNNP